VLHAPGGREREYSITSQRVLTDAKVVQATTAGRYALGNLYS